MQKLSQSSLPRRWFSFGTDNIPPSIWLAVGAGLNIFSSGKWAIAVCAWLAPVFLLRFARTRSPLSGLGWLWLAMFASFYIANRGVIPAPGWIAAAISAMLVLVNFIPLLADRLLSARIPGFVSTLVLPLAWVTMEFAFARLSPYGSWGSVAYTQYGNLPLMQAASVTGIAGIAFLIAWFASVVNWTWEHKFEWKSIRIGLAVYSVIWILAMTLGGARPYLIHTDGKTVRVAAIGWPEGVVTQREFLRAIEPNLASEELEKLRSAFARIQDHFADASLREARAGAKIIVWPEANAMVFQDNEAALLERVQRLASGERIYLLVGMAVVHRGSARPLENKAVLIDPAGMVALSYVKAIPVPGFEARFSRNGARQLLSTDSPYGRLATAICFDMDFPGFIRQAGEAHADLFLVPASDWETIKSLHHISAVYRAIENGVPMVRATRWGLSTAVDPFGRVLGLVDPFASGDPTMVAQVPVGSVRTLYARFGDWFAWMCMAGLLSIIAWRLARHPLKSYKEPL